MVRARWWCSTARPGFSHDPLRCSEALATPERAVIVHDQRGVGLSSGTLAVARYFEQSIEDLLASFLEERGPHDSDNHTHTDNRNQDKGDQP
jgi:pimeloyl-ACP methyl ester carboxylesterase